MCLLRVQTNIILPIPILQTIQREHLLFVLLVLSNRVELQLVLVLSGGDESDPVSELVLLQVSLGQVLQVLTGELSGGHNNDLGAVLGDGGGLTQVTDNTVDLDVLNQVLDVSLLVEDTVVHWSGGVNNELLSDLSVLGGLYWLAYCTFDIYRKRDR